MDSFVDSSIFGNSPDNDNELARLARAAEEAEYELARLNHRYMTARERAYIAVNKKREYEAQRFAAPETLSFLEEMTATLGFMTDELDGRLEELSEFIHQPAVMLDEYKNKLSEFEQRLCNLEELLTIMERELADAFDPSKNRNQLVYGPPEMFGIKRDDT